MGEQDVAEVRDRREFTTKLLEDLRALEMMLEQGSFETGVVRLGAEQELFLVDGDLEPALVADQLLEMLDDPHFTNELARFNLELNLDPVVVRGDALRRFEHQALELVGKAQQAAETLGCSVVLCGILPTLRKEHLTRDAMTPLPRYRALDEAVARLRGRRDVTLKILGRDELSVCHDNVMLEACTTSFQVHRQVDPDSFARLYNVAQLAAGPVLSAAACSPLLFGKVLWRESRIALFEQAVDTRSADRHLREQRGRVSFGDRWVDDSILEIFREDVTRFRVLLARQLERGALEELENGRLPELEALALHNGTVYRWNRPCYGVHDGRAHLRIENRILPAGPTVTDEVANAALWLGVVEAFHREIGDVRRRIAFETVRENFIAAARSGLDAQLCWLDGRRVAARDLIRRELVPMAREALHGLGLDRQDVDRLLWVVWERVRQRRTGAQWLVDGFDAMAPASVGERCASLTAELRTRQAEGAPIVEWPRVVPPVSRAYRHPYRTVGQLMTRDVLTVAPDEVVALAAALMDWRRVRHLPVEDDEQRMIGLVTQRQLLTSLSNGDLQAARERTVADVMERDVVTVEPATETLEAIRLMREHGISGLPVIEKGRLVGIVTERDLFDAVEGLLRDRLEADGGGGGEGAGAPRRRRQGEETGNESGPGVRAVRPPDQGVTSTA